MKGTIISSAKMGFIMGGVAGLAIGFITAIQTRRMILVPITGMMMGCTFACIMGASSVIRADDIRHHAP